MERKPLATERVGRWLDRYFAALRLATFLFVAFLVLAGLSMRSAYGHFTESLLFVGKELSGMEDLIGGSYRVRLNGEPVFVTSTMTEQSVDTVMDRFESHCRDNASAMKDLYLQFPKGSLEREAVNAKDSTMLGVVRTHVKDEGVILCLVQPDGSISGGITERLTRFGQSGDLSDIGRLRYAFMKKTEAGMTHVVTVWTEGAFHVANLAPKGDAQGMPAGLEDFPRPDKSRRVLSAAVDGLPHALQVYESDEAQGPLLEKLNAELVAKGYESVDEVAKAAPDTRTYKGKKLDVFVTVSTQGTKSYVTMMETALKGE